METRDDEELLFDLLLDQEEEATPKPGDPVPVATARSLSNAQERMWLLHQLHPGITAYIIPCHLRLRGRLDVTCLREALRRLWNRHDSLRSIFPARDGVPARTLLPADKLPFVEHELAPGETWSSHYLAHYFGPMRLESGPLFRACLYHIADEEHVLAMDLHHINGDGHSLKVLRRELISQYTALLEGKSVVLPPSESYSDYVALETEWMAGSSYASALDAHIKTLTGAPKALNFAFDKMPPERFGHTGGVLWREQTDLSLPRRLQELGQSSRLSPFMLMLAAFGILLHRHTGQEDLLVGLPVSLRKDSRFDHTIGFFVNTCVARLDFKGRPTLAEVMQRARSSVFEVLSCREVALDQLVHALRDKRNPSRPPLVQATLSYYDDEAPALEQAGGLVVEPIYVSRDSSMFEMTLDIIQQSDRYLVALEYSGELWEARSMERLYGQFFTILKALADNPGQHVDELNLAEPRSTVPGSAPFEGPVLESSQRLVPEWLGFHASQDPSAPALVCAGTEFTRSHLMAAVSERRGQLRREGLVPGDVLALACAPGIEWTVTAIAAMYEGLALLPLDTDVPDARFAHMLADANARLVWHDGSLPLSRIQAVLPCQAIRGSELAPAEPVTEPSRALPGSIAYIIYTSGTTGMPKGVQVSHASFELHCRSAIEAYGLRSGDRALSFAPFFFDAAWEQLFAPLVAGASVLLRDADLWAPGELCHELSLHAVTCADLPPQYLSELLYYLQSHGDSVPMSLRLVVSGGEAMPSTLAKSWLTGPLGHVTLINAYGPTEALVTSTFNILRQDSRILTSNGVVPIGRPMPGRKLYILDANGREQGGGIPGELCIGGQCLADGYAGDAQMTGQRFRHWRRTPSGGEWLDSAEPGSIRLYRSGDTVRLGPDDCLEFLGRMDRQAKIRGFRIELPEVEAALNRLPGIAQSYVLVKSDPIAGDQLIAYCIASDTKEPGQQELLSSLARWLPSQMLPSTIVFLRRFPLAPNGKVDVAALPDPGHPTAPRKELPPADGLEGRIAAIWGEVLGRSDVGLHDNFFDLGGHSLLMMRVHTRLATELDAKTPLVDLYANPTVSRTAGLLRGEAQPHAGRRRYVERADVAVIGMAGRFPGAATVEELWDNLVAGRESVRFFTSEELASAGVPDSLLSRPDYVRAHGYLEGTKAFDAAFFGYTPKEAEVLDPQQRLFLEEAWHALESAGIDPSRYPGDIGVFAGVGFGSYLLANLSHLMRDGHDARAYAVSLSNDKDFLTTRVSYKLNLRGPSMNVNTACSSSLVAIHMAAESVVTGASDVALAGGVTLQIPPESGYLFQPGGIASPDGHCRAFSSEAAGTVGGSGVAVVVLKRLDQALKDGDTIHAVIKGGAVNNDGSDKVGFTAPGLNRQRDVIRNAIEEAGLDACAIRMVEAHGTGTPMGDPIEVQALTQAFEPDKPGRQSCYIGSIKSNIGHLDTAAGVAGFIKAVCSVKHGLIPPTLHCDQPSRMIGFENTPFRVAQSLISWPAGEIRRAAVSSFGMGGTNAHVILEEAPHQASAKPPVPAVWCLPMSARSPGSLLAFARKLAAYLKRHEDIDAGSVWFTLAEGRCRFPVRAVVLARTREDAVAALLALQNQDLLHADRHGRATAGAGSPQDALFADAPDFSTVRAFARVWLEGGNPGQNLLPPPESRRKLPLPGYEFERVDYWIDPPLHGSEDKAATPDAPSKRPVDDWFYFPGWEKVPLQPGRIASGGPLVVFHSNSGTERSWLEAFRASGLVFTACNGRSELAGVLGKLTADKESRIALWYLCPLALGADDSADFVRRLDVLLEDLRALASAASRRQISLLLFSPHVGGPGASPDPSFSYLDAACTVLPYEYGAIFPRVLWVAPSSPSSALVAVLGQAGRLPDTDRHLCLTVSSLWRRTFTRLQAMDAPSEGPRLRQRGVYLITGGLGGIGFSLARYLTDTLKARLVLASRNVSDARTRDLRRELETCGAELRFAALDVTDVKAVRALIDDVGATWGPIDGVIHAAGIPGGSLVARTRLADIENVVKAKVQGTLNLAEALRGREPSFVLLCSSLTASLGGPGQIAYAAANAWIDAFAASQSSVKPGLWTSLQWDAWSGVGMAARSLAGSSAASAARSLVAEWRVTPDTCWAWGEHRIEGVPMLPGTAFLDFFVRALGLSLPLELSSITLKEPVAYHGEDSRLLRVQRADGDLHFQSEDGVQLRDHAKARLCAAPAEPPLLPLEAIEARCPEMLDHFGEGDNSGIVINAGPRWNVSRSCAKGVDEALGRFALPAAFESDLSEHPLHPALLDIALSFYIDFIPETLGMLPWCYEKLRVFRPLVPSIVSHVRVRSRNERAVVFDVDVRDEQGGLLLQVEGYTLIKASSAAMLAPPRDAAAALVNPFAMTPGEGIQVFLKALGIAEPVVCISTVDWRHAAMPPGPDLRPGAADNIPSAQIPAAAGNPMAPRPEGSVLYREPGSAAERIMAGVWSEVLGYQGIGADDDLIDLGADSLMALQASSRLKEIAGQELSMERFFAKPTIANLAQGLSVTEPDMKGTAGNPPAWEEGEL